MFTRHLQDFTAKKAFISLISFEIFLVAMFLISAWVYSPDNLMRQLFNLDGEFNIPALFSAIQLALIGIVFLLKGREIKQIQSSSVFLFVAAGIGFIFLGFDEAFSIHERITHKCKGITWLPRFKNNHGLWIVPYVLVVLSLLLVTFKEILNLLHHYLHEVFLIVFGMAVFFMGAVGLEIIGYQFLSGLEASATYSLEVAFEEFFEMAGASFIMYGALQMLQGRVLAHPRKGVLVVAIPGQFHLKGWHKWSWAHQLLIAGAVRGTHNT